MISHHPVKFSGNSYCGSGDMISVVVEWQDSTCTRLNPSLLFISEAHGMPYSDN